MLYTVWLVNFNTVVYEGPDRDAAMAAAIRTGLECAMAFDNKVMNWSPVGGWRYLC